MSLCWSNKEFATTDCVVITSWKILLRKQAISWMSPGPLLTGRSGHVQSRDIAREKGVGGNWSVNTIWKYLTQVINFILLPITIDSRVTLYYLCHNIHNVQVLIAYCISNQKVDGKLPWNSTAIDIFNQDDRKHDTTVEPHPLNSRHPRYNEQFWKSWLSFN